DQEPRRGAGLQHRQRDELGGPRGDEEAHRHELAQRQARLAGETAPDDAVGHDARDDGCQRVPRAGPDLGAHDSAAADLRGTGSQGTVPIKGEEARIRTRTLDDMPGTRSFCNATHASLSATTKKTNVRDGARRAGREAPGRPPRAPERRLW